jgi:hypothetical protein
MADPDIRVVPEEAELGRNFTGKPQVIRIEKGDISAPGSLDPDVPEHSGTAGMGDPNHPGVV